VSPSAKPLLLWDTNVLMDVLLGRDGDQAVLLLDLAESGVLDLVVPEFVLIEFRGTALRWIRDEKARLDQKVRSTANEWQRSSYLDSAAARIKEGAKLADEGLIALRARVKLVVERVVKVARVEQHTMDLHFRGDLRFLRGDPPDRPVDGIKDCRIYEAVFSIAQAELGRTGMKYLVTRDGDFDYQELRDELNALGFIIRSDIGPLFKELRPQQSATPKGAQP
jgi:predicted nucleic acid-binding protein